MVCPSKKRPEWNPELNEIASIQSNPGGGVERPVRDSDAPRHMAIEAPFECF